MNLVKSITPLLNIFGFDNGRFPAVVTLPALPTWQPAPGDTNAVERVINRVKVDGNVTIEQEVIFISQPAPRPAAVRERSNGGAIIVDCDGNQARPELVAKYYSGFYDVMDTAPEVPRQSWER